jgi:ABC-type dipeptide/oligopeptide/nickel transport system permease component
MWRHIISRVIQAVICLIGVSFIVFMLARLSGDPALLLAPPDASFEDIQALRVQWGFDKPLYIQYWKFISNAVQGDLGQSIKWGKPTLDLWLSKFPNTLLLGGVAFLFSVIVGVTIGVVGAIKAGTWIDTFGKIFAFMGVSLPVFWIALLFMILFSVKLGWLPTAGMGTWKHLIMPAFTLGWFFTASQVRISRSAMLDVLDSEYVKLARIKGVPGYRVYAKHALRNALIPIVTLGGLNLAWLLNGTVIIETIFNWKGIGWLAVEAIFTRDYAMVQTCALMGSAVFIFINLFVDILYAYIDPRLRHEQSS